MRRVAAAVVVVLAVSTASDAGAAATKIRIGAKCSPAGRHGGPETASGAVCTNKTGTLKWENAGDAVVRWTVDYGITAGRRKILDFAALWCEVWNPSVPSRSSVDDPDDVDAMVTVFAQQFGWSRADVLDTVDSVWLAVCPSRAPSRRRGAAGAAPAAPVTTLVAASAVTAAPAATAAATAPTAAPLTVPPTVPPTIISVAEAAPIVLQGVGRQASAAFPLQKGMIRVFATNRGQRNFIVTLVNARTARRVEGLFNEIGQYAGTQLFAVAQADDYVLNIDADASWSIEITQPRPVTGGALPPASISSNGPSALGPFVQGTAARVSMRHSGKRNFILTTYSPTEGRLRGLANEIGVWEGVELVPAVSGAFFINVVADGPWTIDFANA